MIPIHLKIFRIRMKRFKIEINAIVFSIQFAQASQNQQSPKTGSGKDADQNGAQNTQVSNAVVPGPQSASHVVVEDKKKKKCTCCVIQ